MSDFLTPLRDIDPQAMSAVLAPAIEAALRCGAALNPEELGQIVERCVLLAGEVLVTQGIAVREADGTLRLAEGQHLLTPEVAFQELVQNAFEQAGLDVESFPELLGGSPSPSMGMPFVMGSEMGEA
ncbi:MAG: hypothetical protein H6739_04765 [Alphaproteobacteria bacterium]|nr:hypothetical protein [Alphaproteobacteria bacterium]